MPSVVQRAFRRLLRAQPSLFAFDSLLAAASRSFRMARTLAASSPSIPVTRNPVYVSAVVPPSQVSARLTQVQAAEDAAGLPLVSVMVRFPFQTGSPTDRLLIVVRRRLAGVFGFDFSRVM